MVHHLASPTHTPPGKGTIGSPGWSVDVNTVDTNCLSESAERFRDHPVEVPGPMSFPLISRLPGGLHPVTEVPFRSVCDP